MSRVVQIIRQRGAKGDPGAGVDWLNRDETRSITSVNRAGPMPSGTSGNLVIIGNFAVNGENGAISSLTDSVFCGTQAGRLVRFGNGNVAIGNLTIAETETSTHNTTGGDASLRKLKIGDGNSIWGYVAATELEFGSWNTVNGSYAAAYSKRGSYNQLAGGYSGAHSEFVRTYNGDYCIFNGWASGQYNQGNRNIGYGHEVLFDCEGDEQISIGNDSGKSLTKSVISSDLAIATVTSQTVFVLTGGPVVNHAEIGVIVKDFSDTNRPYTARGNYVAASNTLTITTALPITVTTSDLVTLQSIPNRNICIGLRAGSATGVQKVDAKNVILIGTDTSTQDDNSTVIGNSSTTRTRLRGDLNCGSINIESNWINTPGPTNGAVWRGGGNLYLTSDTNSITFVSNTNGLFTARLYNNGRFCWLPPASANPDDNGEVCLQFTSNTTLTLKGKGTDGVVRSVNFTIA